MLYNPDFNQYRIRFYQYRTHFNKFNDVRDENSNLINDNIIRFKKSYDENGFILTYENFLGFALNNRELNYDEKVYMLIRIFDPKLMAYFFYKDANIISSKQIKQEENDFVKKSLNDERNLQLEEYKNRVRNEIGFYENDLPTYELAFYKKYINQELIFGNKRNVAENLFDELKDLKSLIIDNDRVEAVKDIVKKYKLNYPTADMKDVFYQALYQYNILGLKSKEEIALFLIKYLDDKLLLSQIYFEESKFDVIRKRSKEEINFFHTELVRLEELYVKEYLPELFIQRKLTWK